MRIAVDAEELLALQFGTPADVVNGTLRAGLRDRFGPKPLVALGGDEQPGCPALRTVSTSRTPPAGETT
ncbi:hypothetical protein [Streptomyces sp. NPDC051001]|uniref:hypothetical protein n=1 Tax=Streptomyces sp. NPDC051001 TaxID=3155795 RepID=UPI00341A924F